MAEQSRDQWFSLFWNCTINAIDRERDSISGLVCEWRVFFIVDIQERQAPQPTVFQTHSHASGNCRSRLVEILRKWILPLAGKCFFFKRQEMNSLTPHFQPSTAVLNCHLLRCCFAAVDGSRATLRRTVVWSRWLLQIYLMSIALIECQCWSSSNNTTRTGASFISFFPCN